MTKLLPTPNTLDPQLLDQLLQTYPKPENLLGEHGLLKQLTKALIERALKAELTDHLGHAPLCISKVTHLKA